MDLFVVIEKAWDSSQVVATRSPENSFEFKMFAGCVRLTFLLLPPLERLQDVCVPGGAFMTKKIYIYRCVELKSRLLIMIIFVQFSHVACRSPAKDLDGLFPF